MASPSPVPGRSSVPQAITFGDDGSAGADAAWRWLTAQAWPGWTVDVIRARPTAGEAAPVSAGGRAPRVMPRRCEAVRVRTLTTPLAPAAALLEHSGTGVVVIGAGRVERDRSGGRQALLTTLVADGHRPVLVAREGRAMRSALVVADGSVQAEAAARVLASLPPAQAAITTIVAVEDAHGTGAERVDALRRVLAATGLRTTIRIVHPGPTVATSRTSTVLLAEIDRQAPDLVVMGGRGTGALARRVTGSLALDVARSATCSVLLGPRHLT